MTDEQYMMRALALARKAAKRDEVPVGALVVKDGRVVAEAFNRKEKANCALYHAEMLALKKASRRLHCWYLEGCTLYVTLEPCPMCAGAVINSRVDRVVFGAGDEKAGAYGGKVQLAVKGTFNHTPEVKGGVLAEQCGNILTEFFRKKRLEKQNIKKN